MRLLWGFIVRFLRGSKCYSWLEVERFGVCIGKGVFLVRVWVGGRVEVLRRI